MIRRTPQSEAMLSLYNLTWAVTTTYHMSAPWGLTQVSLTVDAPELYGKVPESVQLGLELWNRSIATAMCRSVYLEFQDTICWHQIPIGMPIPRLQVRGQLFGASTGRDDSACIVMHTGHADSYARRRMILPGIPKSWVVDGLLTENGMGKLEDLGHMMMMGMAAHITGGPMAWLIAYPDALDPEPGNFTGVGFRSVEYLRICHHTERAPDTSIGP